MKQKIVFGKLFLRTSTYAKSHISTVSINSVKKGLERNAK